MDKNSSFIRDSFAYWNGVFQDDALEVLVQKSRNVPDYEEAVLKKQINGAVWERISKLSKGNCLTIYTVLLSILEIQMKRCFDQNTTVIGVPTYHKERAGSVKLLPLKQSPELKNTYKQHLLDTKQELEAFYHFQSYSLGNIPALEGLKEEKLYYTVTMIMKELYSRGQIQQLCGKRHSLQIMAEITENASMTFTFSYNRLLCGHGEMEVFADTYIWLLEQCMNQLDIKLDELSITSPKQRQKVLSEFNQTFVSIPEGKTIVDVFEEQVKKNPNADAVICDDKKLSFQELDRLSGQIASYLVKKGLEKEQVVGILLNRSCLLPAAMLGILKAGGAYLPMDPEHPKDRISYMLEDSQAAFVITQTEFKSEIGNTDSVIDLDQISSELKSEESLKIPVGSRNLAYMIYTSGSTGKPKGVMIEHEQVINFVEGMNRGAGLCNYKNILGLTTVSFDIFGLEVWGSLLNGLSLVLVFQGSTVDGDTLAEILKKFSVDVLQATPSRLFLLLESKKFETALASVKAVLIGGEAVPDTLLKKLQKMGHFRIYDVYGPTETTIWSTLKEVTQDERITIGKPMANTQIYIVKNGQLCGVESVGEICIGGRGVGRGYWNREELTKEKFIKNPFGEGRIYKTGDLGKWLEDGNLKCMGRMDDQVKIRGLRIELGEITHAIRMLADVTDAATVVRERADGGQLLCAYVTSHKKLNGKQLKEELFQSLPAYMVPQFIMQLEKLPLNQNGKIDKKSLPEISYESREVYCAPRSQTEKEIAEVFEELFELKQAGIYDKFNDLGGNSLMAIKLHVALEKRGYAFQVSDAAKYQTVEQIAAFLDGKVEMEEEKQPEKELEVQPAAEMEKADGSICISGIEPFNLFYFRTCFFNGAFSVIQYFNRDVLKYVLNTMNVYDQVPLWNVDILEDVRSSENPDSLQFFGLKYLESKDFNTLLEEDGISWRSRENSQEMIPDIQNAVNNGHPVIVGLDYFYESIRKDTYQKEHALHFVLVYGYHPVRKVFYIIEHHHRDNLSYEKREISYEDLNNAHAMAYQLEAYQKVMPSLFFEFWESREAKTAEELILPEKFYVANYCSYQKEVENGIYRLDDFLTEYESMIQDKEHIEKNARFFLSHLNSIINAKLVELYKLKQIFDEDFSLCQLQEQITAQWESVRIQLAKCMYMQEYSTVRLKKNIARMEKIIELEKEYLDTVLELEKEEA